MLLNFSGICQRKNAINVEKSSLKKPIATEIYVTSVIIPQDRRHHAIQPYFDQLYYIHGQIAILKPSLYVISILRVTFFHCIASMSNGVPIDKMLPDKLF